MNNTGSLWQDRKRIFFGLPWTFTVYTLTDDRLIVKSGVFNTSEDEIRLYRILDVTLKRSFWERLFNLGTLHLCTADKSSPEIDVLHIKNPREVKDMIHKAVEEAKDQRRMRTMEIMGGEAGDCCDDMDAAADDEMI